MDEMQPLVSEKIGFGFEEKTGKLHILAKSVRKACDS